MKIEAKITLIAVAGLLTATGATLLVQRAVVRRNGIEITQDNMRKTIMQAENVRQSVSALINTGAIDFKHLAAEAKGTANYRDTLLYKTIPIIAAGQVLDAVSKEQGFEYRVTRRNARNPKNEPTPDEENILRYFDTHTGADQNYSAMDKAKNQVVFARPIVLTNDCLACHGDPKNSPTGDGNDALGFPMENWHAGETRGAFILRTNLSKVDASVNSTIMQSVGWVSGVLAAIIIGTLLVTRKIGKSLQMAVGVVRRVSERDLSMQVEVTSNDEVGEMCQSLNQMVANLSENVSAIGGSSQSVAAAAEELSAVSSTVTISAEAASAQSGSVAAAAEQVSANVSTVATAAEEMGSTIKEIARNASDAARVAGQAVLAAQESNASVAKLGVSSEEIGEVIKVITSIAEQTNLLALNATIEAARAGEAGKGFAVVANEVKELAKQTAAATEDISRKIATIQSDSRGAVAAIGKIGGIIDQISEMQTTIASAVEEQTAATGEIARNAAEAAKCSGEISRSITEVTNATRTTNEGAVQTLAASQELARLAAALEEIVAQFKLDQSKPVRSEPIPDKRSRKVPTARPHEAVVPKARPQNGQARPPVGLQARF